MNFRNKARLDCHHSSLLIKIFKWRKVKSGRIYKKVWTKSKNFNYKKSNQKKKKRILMMPRILGHCYSQIILWKI